VLEKGVFVAFPLNLFAPHIKGIQQECQIEGLGALERIFHKPMIDAETLSVILCVADRKSTPGNL